MVAVVSVESNSALASFLCSSSDKFCSIRQAAAAGLAGCLDAGLTGGWSLLANFFADFIFGGGGGVEESNSEKKLR